MPVVETARVVKLFYTVLYSLTALLALTWWSREGRRDALVPFTAWRGSRAEAAEVNGGQGMPGMGLLPAPPIPGTGNSSAAAVVGAGLNAPLPAPSRPDIWPGGRSANVAPLPNPSASAGTVPATYTPPAATAIAPPGYPPASNPTNPVSYQATIPPAGTNPVAGASLERPLAGPQILARVGPEEVVLASDLLPEFNAWLEQKGSMLPPSRVPEVREAFLRQRLEQAIQTKVILAEMKHKIPTEGFKHFHEELEKQFDKTELPGLMEKYSVDTQAQLDQQLQKIGGSIDHERRAFVEKVMAISWVQQQVKTDEEVTYESMLYYYHLHPEEFELENKARWEELAVRFDKYPNREAAYNALAQAGNEVLKGAKFADVARRMSQGVTANNGGEFDWTKKGSLVSTVLDQALFSLPVAQLSPILEDATGFHIVRVIERQEAGQRSFIDAQPGIKEKIQEERRGEAINTYVSKLRARTGIWTVYDGHQNIGEEEQKLPYGGASTANLGAAATLPAARQP